MTTYSKSQIKNPSYQEQEFEASFPIQFVIPSLINYDEKQLLGKSHIQFHQSYRILTFLLYILKFLYLSV
jgi:hypothetical protein